MSRDGDARERDDAEKREYCIYESNVWNDDAYRIVSCVSHLRALDGSFRGRRRAGLLTFVRVERGFFLLVLLFFFSFLFLSFRMVELP